MKTICALTSSRADFGLLLPVLERIHGSGDLALELVVTGTHLSPRHGSTVREVEASGLPISARIDAEVVQGGAADQPPSLAILMGGLAKAWTARRPDVLLVLGDRGEPLVAAMVAVYRRVPIVHLHGGEDTHGGNVDDTVRHAISKLAHFHCAATAEDARRLVERLGEESWRVRCTGSPAWERLYGAAERGARRGFAAGRRPLAVHLQHSETSRPGVAGSQFRAMAAALEEIVLARGGRVVLLAPNMDEGSENVFAAIDEVKRRPGFEFVANLPPGDFAALLASSDVLVGNSSAGILEAPFLALPVVNAGNRQAGRRRAPNVVDCPSFERRALAGAIARALELDRDRLREGCPALPPSPPSEAILDVLRRVDAGLATFQKRLEGQDGRP